MSDFFVVLQDIEDGFHTIYPEVHYVYQDDTFSPALDVAEQQPDDISVLVDMSHDGSTVMSCHSLSPGWQVVSTSLETQALHCDMESKLLSISGTNARQSTDIPDLNGSFDTQVESTRKIVARLEKRNQELRRILEQANS